MTVCTFAQLSWPGAFAIATIALSVAGAVFGFFWSLTKD